MVVESKSIPIAKRKKVHPEIYAAEHIFLSNSSHYCSKDAQEPRESPHVGDDSKVFC
jgi:hypothetical protein